MIEVLEYARDNFPAVIGRGGGAGSEGWCVLVDGEDGLKVGWSDFGSSRSCSCKGS